MTVVYSEDAKATLFEISDFIDSINTIGAGERWIAKLAGWLKSFALSNVKYALCNDEYLAYLGLSCVNYNDWVIVFTIEEDLFLVHEIIRGSLLI